MRIPALLYVSGILILLIGAGTLPEKPHYQINSMNTAAENAAAQAKIDREYTSILLSSVSFKLIVSGIVIIVITIPYHIWLRRTVEPLALPLVLPPAPVLPPLHATPIKSALRSTKVARPEPDPEPDSKPPTPPAYAGPVIRYFRINHAPPPSNVLCQS